GRTGEKGFRGMEGEDGTPGQSGESGELGPRGPKGFPANRPGEKGAIGDMGYDGVRGQCDEGPKGPPGETGSCGTPGIPGLPGPAGISPAGQKGEKGVKNYQIGPKGPPGRQGNTGNRGDLGRKGSLGDTGPRGPQGFSGIKGEEGYSLKGYKGDKGEGGDIGPQGRRGVSGNKGQRGLNGFVGSAGGIGLPGNKGMKGNTGSPSDNDKGIRGDEGDIGVPGPQGSRGLNGKIGLPGERGEDGERGSHGEFGQIGEIGFKGEMGHRGRQGASGPRGAKGSKGTLGQDGVQTHLKKLSYFITRHSQSRQIPECPIGTKKMWDGFSLSHFVGDHLSQDQDLGQPSSCLQVFNPMPFIFCSSRNSSETCNYASRNDYSYWLSTENGQRRSTRFTNIEGDEIKNYVSRCSVCEATRNVITVHSQSAEVPDCPLNWMELWSGYSFLMYTKLNNNRKIRSADGKKGAGQQLSSPGSCLETFQHIPFIECHGRGTCNYFTSSLSFWLSSIDESHMFKKPKNETFKGEAYLRKVSRCSVCLRIQSSIQITTSRPVATTATPTVPTLDISASGDGLTTDDEDLVTGSGDGQLTSSGDYEDSEEETTVEIVTYDWGTDSPVVPPSRRRRHKEKVYSTWTLDDSDYLDF
ncbi:hypothetical protein QYM36_012957, partial [Artemia franciscana]